MRQEHPLWSPATRRSGLPEGARLRLFALRATTELGEATASALGGQTSIAFTSGRPGALPDEAVLQTIRGLALPSAWRGKLARFVPVAPRASTLEDLERRALERVGKSALMSNGSAATPKAEACLSRSESLAEANRANVRLVEQFLCEARRRRGRNRNLETVLARIAGARNVENDTIPPKVFGRHEGHFGNCRFRKPRPFDSRSSANQSMIVA